MRKRFTPALAQDALERALEALRKQAGKLAKERPEKREEAEKLYTEFEKVLRSDIAPVFAKVYADETTTDRVMCNNEAERRIRLSFRQSDRKRSEMAGMLTNIYMRELAKLPNDNEED